MSGGFDPAVVRQWLYETLTDDAPLVALLTGGWHRGKAPSGTPYPFGTFHLQGPGQDTTSVSRRRILSNGLWLVRATGVMGESDGNLDTIAAMIDGVLDRASGDAGTGHVYMATRELPWDRDYDENGQSYVEAGGLYRIWVQDPVAA
jgi:hypothetical protein